MVRSLRSPAIRLTLLLSLLMVSGTASAISNIFTYQGSLEDGGQPADGVYDILFYLWETPDGSDDGWSEFRDNVVVSKGVFTVDLDFGSFGSAMFQDLWMQIGVRPGASEGSFTFLAPFTRIAPTPQAQAAGIAAVATMVSSGSINSASIADGTIGSADIADGSVTSTDIANETVGSADIDDGSIAAVDINNTQIQQRVAAGCASDEAIRSINADGTVVCVEGPLGPPAEWEVAFGTLFLSDDDFEDTRNFAVTEGRLALVNSGSHDTSSDLDFSHDSGDTIITVNTAGLYEFSYHITFRATDASPDIYLGVFFSYDQTCNLTAIENNITGIAPMNIDMVVDDQLLYPMSGSEVVRLLSNTCVALKAYEYDPAAGNEAEMTRVRVTARRVK